MALRRTDVFIDGFNLEFGAMRPAQLHWIDLRKLATRLLPRAMPPIGEVRLYTAPLHDSPERPFVSTRQAAWFRALESAAEVRIILGHHVNQMRLLPLVVDGRASRQLVRVLQSVEKSSDVNLAVDLVDRAHRAQFHAGMVISNDGDLSRAVGLVASELKRPVIVVNPQPHRQSRSLARCATALRTLRRGDLNHARLSPQVSSAGGTIQMPPPWWIP